MARPPGTPQRRTRLFALADCSDFYVSCERVFAPHLAETPVVVLSNNDGCVVSRSHEAKALGIRMGAPYFKARGRLEAAGAAVFSSNYPLYADVSRRIGAALDTFSPDVERYSIDEAFLHVCADTPAAAAALGRSVHARVKQWTGVPIRVGLAPTKTLAKAASEAAKPLAKAKRPPVVCLWDEADRRAALEALPVGEVWGIGPRWAKRLRAHGVATAAAFAALPDAWIRREMNVVALRTAYELRGVSCLPLELAPAPRQSLVRSRSFGRAVTDRAELAEALATHTARAAEKLRAEGLAAGVLDVFVTTKAFGEGPHRTLRASAAFRPRTLDTARLLGTARRLVSQMYRPAAPDGTPYRWKKAGVMLLDLAPEAPAQAHLFDAGTSPARRALLDAVDAVNGRWGRRTLVWGSQGTVRERADTETGQAWAMRQARRSPRYTTCWDDLPRVRA